MIGERFNCAVVVRKSPSKTGCRPTDRRWVLRCQCGDEFERYESGFKEIFSCGCTRRRRLNRIEKHGEIAYMWLYHPEGDRRGVIDAEDADRVQPYLWSWSSRSELEPCIVTREHGTREQTPLGKFLLDNKEKGRKAVHVNGDYLDYRKANLRCGNKIRIDGDVAHVEVYGAGLLKEVAIDVADIATIKKYAWRIAPATEKKDYLIVSGRLLNSKNKKAQSMARVLMRPPKHLEVDHIDRNTLNNRRSNLRIVTRAANNQNRVTGGGINLSKGRYGVVVCLGVYKTLKEATRVAQAFRKVHKPFAPEVTNDFY